MYSGQDQALEFKSVRDTSKEKHELIPAQVLVAQEDIDPPSAGAHPLAMMQALKEPVHSVLPQRQGKASSFGPEHPKSCASRKD